MTDQMKPLDLDASTLNGLSPALIASYRENNDGGAVKRLMLGEKRATTEALPYRRGNFNGAIDHVIIDALMDVKSAAIDRHGEQPSIAWHVIPNSQHNGGCNEKHHTGYRDGGSCRPRIWRSDPFR